MPVIPKGQTTMLRTMLRLAPLMWLMLQENPAAEDDDGDDSEDANAGGNDGGNGDQPYAIFPDEKSFQQRVSRDATGRLRKQAQELGFDSVDDMLAAAKAKRDADDKAKSDLEKAQQKADKAEADRQAAIERSNERLIKAQARAIASELGVAAERVSYAVRLADLSEVAVDADGEPDEDAIKAAIEQVLTDVPELKMAGAGGSRSGGEFNNGNKSPKTNPWKKESRNLTEQGRLLRENPALAEQLQREAKG